MEFENEERSDTISDVLQKCQRDNINWSPGISGRGNFPKSVEISKNSKNCLICLYLDSESVEFCKFR